MGYRWRLDGINDYAQFGSSLSIDFGLAAYTFEAKLILNATPSFLGGLLGRNGTTSGFFITPTLTLAMYVTNTLRYQTAANFFLVDGNVHTYRLEHDTGGAWRAYRDGVLFGSGTFTSSTVAAPLIWIGQGNNSANTYCSMDLEHLEVTGVTNAQKWNANLSGGTGLTLQTESGTNQATLTNTATDGSQWVSFSDGADTALQAAITCTSSLGAALTTQIPLASAMSSSSSLSASLTTSIALQTAITTISALTANLRAGITPLSADMQCTTSLTANLSGGAETTVVVPLVGFTYRFANRYGQLANKGLLTNKGRRTLKGAPVP